MYLYIYQNEMSFESKEFWEQYALNKERKETYVPMYSFK